MSASKKIGGGDRKILNAGLGVLFVLMVGCYISPTFDAVLGVLAGLGVLGGLAWVGGRTIVEELMLQRELTRPIDPDDISPQVIEDIERRRAAYRASQLAGRTAPVAVQKLPPRALGR